MKPMSQHVSKSMSQQANFPDMKRGMGWALKFAMGILLLLLACPTMAQNSKKVRDLKAQQAQLQKTLKRSQEELSSTKKKVSTGIRDLDFLGGQMQNRLTRIKEMEQDMQRLDQDIKRRQANIVSLESDLQKARRRLKTAMRYARMQRISSNSSLQFALSANSLQQVFRRARYAHDYVAFQHDMSAHILQKQNRLLREQNALLESKTKLNNTVCEVMMQRKQLNVRHEKQQVKVDNLKKQQKTLTGKVAEQQKQLSALNKKIDQLIAYEIEQARKRAEEEARRKAAAAAAKKKGTKNNKTGSGGSASASSSGDSSPAPTKGNWLTPEDRKLNGTFEQNKGRLPVPITGQYMLGNRFGVYNVPGLKNVQLDNKGTNYVGQSGARARAIFDGVVTAVFQFDGTKNVLVRHGSYISVYCNLSSVIVSKGQKVKTRDILGTVANDGSGKFVLHFQLRKETAKLNPEAWIGR